MNTPKNVSNDQEIDLSQISNKINQVYENFLQSIFKGLLFIKRNLIVLIILFIAGAALGFFIDRSTKVYEHEITVVPNFGSTDYLYSTINLLNSRIKERDTVFLKSIGIKKTKSITKIEIEPVVDIYNFVNEKTNTVSNAQNTQNFELLKLLSESADINKVMKEEITSKNYPYHIIKIISVDPITNENTLNPILDYLNTTDYFKNIQRLYVENTKAKMQKNAEIIQQIDVLLDKFSITTGNEKNDKLVYYNENTNLNGLISTKNDLINEQGIQKLNLFSFEKIIREKNRSINVKIVEGLNNKMKFILPFLFIAFFCGFNILASFYKKQALKYNARLIK